MSIAYAIRAKMGLSGRSSVRSSVAEKPTIGTFAGCPSLGVNRVPLIHTYGEIKCLTFWLHAHVGCTSELK